MSTTEPTLVCNLCPGPPLGEAEHALVPCNVRRFKDESFPVWRCSRCGSIHSGAEVDLASYYRHYPYHGQKLDAMSMLFYDTLLRRLRRGGLRREHRLLDYGCGGGQFVRFLHWKGFKGAVGYDAYSPQFSDRGLLAERYDFVLAQDVLEHVAEPLGLLRELAALCRPAGLLAIGTPNAAAIDLTRAGDFRHTLHQPYHRHILSKSALLRATAELGWELLRYYPRQYSNTLWPFLNQAFVLYYARLFDDTMDLAFDGPRFHWRMFSPRALLLAFFGYFLSVESDVMAIFRVP